MHNIFSYSGGVFTVKISVPQVTLEDNGLTEASSTKWGTMCNGAMTIGMLKSN